MRIAAYVVCDPSSNEEILQRCLQGIASSELVPLTLRSVDEFPLEDIMVNFGVRQVDVDDFGQKHFIGVFYDDDQKMVINLFIPPWDEETKVKISPFPNQP